MDIKVGASILSADCSRLGDVVRKLEQAGVDFVSFDVMDGHFVDNISFGPAVVSSLRPETSLPFEAHLMVTDPGKIAERFVDAGCSLITVHREAAEAEKTLARVRKRAKAGIAVKPETPFSSIAHLIGEIDMVLIMTVHPGFGGQAFLDQSAKIREARAFIERGGYGVDVAVDGGMNERSAPVARKAGANVLVAGSFITGHADYASAVRTLKGIP